MIAEPVLVQHCTFSQSVLQFCFTVCSCSATPTLSFQLQFIQITSIHSYCININNISCSIVHLHQCKLQQTNGLTCIQRLVTFKYYLYHKQVLENQQPHENGWCVHHVSCSIVVHLDFSLPQITTGVDLVNPSTSKGSLSVCDRLETTYVPENNGKVHKIVVYGDQQTVEKVLIAKRVRASSGTICDCNFTQLLSLFHRYNH